MPTGRVPGFSTRVELPPMPFESLILAVDDALLKKLVLANALGETERQAGTGVAQGCGRCRHGMAERRR